MTALRNMLLAPLAAALCIASPPASASDFLTGAVSGYPTGWSAQGTNLDVVVVSRNAGNVATNLAFSLDDAQTLTYSPANPSASGGTADVVISNAVFTTAYEYPGVEAVGGIDSQAAICVAQIDPETTPSYYGWVGAYTVEGTTTNLTWLKLAGAAPPAEGTPVTVTMSFDYTAVAPTVTFKAGGQTLNSSGTTAIPLHDSTKTQVSAVLFSGEGSLSEMGGAQEEPAPSEYAVQFFGEDTTSSLFGPTNVPAGTAPVYLGAAPTKQATGQYTYHFAGWTNAVCTVPTNIFDAVTGAVNYYAVFTNTVNEYTISWDTDGDGDADDTTTVAYGTIPTHADGSKAADAQYTYSFTGWDTTPAAVTGPATYTAQFSSTVNEYTISWDTDGNGTVDDTTTVAYGTIPTHADGSKAADAQYAYSFTGWDTTPVAVTGPATYTAQFSSTVNKYTVTFEDDDHTEISSADYDYGTAAADIVKPSNPTKAATAQYTYEFSGWSPTVANVTGDATYTATYSSTVNEYTITWSIDGTDTTETLAYGATPSHADPTKASSATTVYTFTGWNPAIGTVSGDQTYTAQFSQTVRSYTVTFENYDGTQLQSASVEYGQTPVYGGETPTKPATSEYTYTFSGWSPEVAAVSGEQTYVAQFSETEIVASSLRLADPTIGSTAIANGQTGAVVKVTVAPAAVVTSTNANVAFSSAGGVTNATFTSLPWNEAVDWQLSAQGCADPLPGRFYAKGETQWFSTNLLGDIETLSDGMKGVSAATPSASNQMVRIQTKLELADGGMDALPVGADVGAARTGFAVARLAGDEQDYFYAFNGSTWDRLLGVDPVPNTTNDVLAVLDVEASTARYYVNGKALYKEDAGVRTYAIPMGASEDGAVHGIGFANPDGVVAPIVAEYDVPFEAAVGDVPYAAAADGLSHADKTGAATLYLLTNGVAGTIDLAVGQSLKVDTAKGSFSAAEPVVLASGVPAGYALEATGEGSLTNYAVVAVEYPITWNLGLDGATNAVANALTNSYTVETLPVALYPAGREDYTFDGWTNNVAAGVQTAIPAGTTGAVTNWATWHRNAFTITWNVEGDTSVTSEVLPGDVPAWPGAEDPAKAADNTYTYRFTGWTPTPVAASENAEYTAVFEPVYIDYAITWNYVDPATGTATSDQNTVHWGAVPSHADPADYVANDTMYAFDAWSPAPAVYDGTVTSYTATYTSTAAKAMVFTVADNGNGTAATNTVGYYATLADAVSAATNGCTVLLLADAALSSTVSVTNDLTIDLDGNNVAATDCRAIWVKSGNVRITGSGTISAAATASAPESFGASSVVRVGDSVANVAAAALAIDTNVVVSSSACYGVTVFGKNDADDDPATADISLDLYGTVAVTSSGDADAAISGQGRSDYLAADITVHDGATVSSANSAAIYFPGAGTLTVDGGSITGLHGIVARAGDVVVNGGTVTATGTGAGEVLGDNNDIVVPYAAISYTTSLPDVWQHYASGDKATINGGTIVSAVKPCVLQLADAGDAAAVLIPADSTARFSDNKAEGVAAGYALKKVSGTSPVLYEVAADTLLTTSGSLSAAPSTTVYYVPGSETVPQTNLTMKVTYKRTVSGFKSGVLATALPDDLGYAWSSSDTSVATVEDGIVTLLQPGSARITLVMTDALDPSITKTVSATVSYDPYRARIVGGDYYASLGGAVNKAVKMNNATIEMCADEELSAFNLVSVTGGGTVTIDLAGHSFSSPTNSQNRFNVKNANLVVTNSAAARASIDWPGSSGLFTVTNGTATLCGDVAIETPCLAAVYANGSFVMTTGTVAAAGSAVNVYDGGSFTMDGGSVTTPSTGVWVYDDASFTMNGGSIAATSSGVVMYGAGAAFTMNGGAIAAETGVSANGSVASNTAVAINGGTITAPATGAGVFHSQSGTLAISGGTITGGTAVFASQGTVNVTGGELVATGAAVEGYTPPDSYYTASGDALVLVNRSAPAASITGGTFTSANAKSVASYASGSNAAVSDFLGAATAAGTARFSDDVSDDLADGYVFVESETSGYYKVVGTATVIWVVEAEATTNTVPVGTATDSIQPANPTKAATAEYAYTFAGWSPAPDATVTSNATYTAVFDETSLGAAIWIAGASGDWAVPANWDIGYVPTSATVVTFTNDAEVAISNTDACKGMVLDNAAVSLVRASGVGAPILRFYGNGDSAVSVASGKTGSLAVNDITLFNERVNYTDLTIGSAFEVKGDVSFRGISIVDGSRSASFAITGKTTVSANANVKTIDYGTTKFQGGVEVAKGVTAKFTTNPKGGAKLGTGVTLVANDGAGSPTAIWLMQVYNKALLDGASVVVDADHAAAYDVKKSSATETGTYGGDCEVYEATLKRFDVIWIADGTEFASNRVDYGEATPVPATDPTKTPTAACTYTFASWSPQPALTVTNDATYTAVFNETTNQYTVAFVDEDGTTVLQAATAYDYGTAAADIVTPADPTKAADAQYTYEFAGWSPAVGEVVSNATYTATYTPTAKTFTVLWLAEGGESQLGATNGVPYGTAYASLAEPTPTKQGNAQFSYTFAGWTPEPETTITNNATYTASFTETTNKYTVAWNANGGTLSGEYTNGEVDYGTPLVPPTAAKADDADYTYEFLAWEPALDATVTSNVSYTATYASTPKAVTVYSIALDDPTLSAAGSSGTTVTVSAKVGDNSVSGPVDVVAVDGAVGEATAGVVEAAFAGDWNQGVPWMITNGTAALEGKTYVKAETTLFTATTNQFESLGDMGAAGVGYTNPVASAAGEAVRVNTTIEVPEGALDSEPEVGDATAGFAVLQLAGDSVPAYYAFNKNGSTGTWTKLSGVVPAAGEHDYLAVYDFAAPSPTVRYYIDGVSLYAAGANGAKVYAIPLTGMTSLSTIAFGSAEMVKDTVVAKQDVSYAAAVSSVTAATGYTNALDAVAALSAADKAASNAVSVTLLAANVGGAVSLAIGDAVTVSNANFAGGPTFTASAGRLVSTTNGTTQVWSAEAVSDPLPVDPGTALTVADLAGGVVPVGVETVVDEGTGDETRFFVVKFRAPEAGVTYTLMKSTVLTLTEEQWKGVGENAAVPVSAEGGSKTSAAVDELVTLKAVMSDEEAFFKVRATFE